MSPSCVKDADGKRIPDLKKEDFEIYEDGVLQEIADFKPASHPLRLILLFDTSVSMGAIFPAVKDEAVKLVESLNQLDEIMIGAFDTDLQWSSDWGGKALATSEILALKSTSNPQPTASSPQPTPPRPSPLPPGGAFLAARFLAAGCLTRTRISSERCAPSLIGLEAGAETRSF